MEPFIRNLVAMVFFLVSTGAPVLAESTVWTRIGPAGVNLAAVAVDPQSPGTVYAANNGSSPSGPSQVFKSIDGGANWSTLSALPMPGQTVGIIDALAIDPITPGTVYAYGQGGLFKSIDGGESWVDTGFPASVRTPAIDPRGVTTLAIDPQNPEVIYAGTFVCSGLCGGRVFKSTDGGHTWMTPTLVFTDPVCSQAISASAVDPQNPWTVYATITDCNDQGGDLFKSTDGGITWTKTTLHVFTYYEYENAIAIDPQNPERIYVGTGYGVATSTDGGESWDQADFLTNSSLPEQFPVTALAIDQQNPGTVYAGGYAWPQSASPQPVSAIFKSVDGGIRWVPFRDVLSGLYIRSVALTPGSPGLLYAGTSGGVFKTEDPGQ